MKKNTELSIIIVNFNTYQVLSGCLESIYNSTLSDSKYEIIVVDNASEDNSVPLIRKHHRRVLLVVNSRNMGFAKANNQAAERAKSNFILFLNPDTIVEKNTLSAMLKFMKQNPNIGIATCRVTLPNGDLDDACHRGFPTPWSAFCQFSGLASVLPKSKLFNSYHLGFNNINKVHEIDSCAGAFMMVRKEVGEQIGWFDEDYFWYGDDLDFCFRVKERGWKVMYKPGVQIMHYKGVASGIKKHSRHLSWANEDIKRLATKTRFEVMRIFYQKHYKDKYPSWLTALVMKGIELKERFNNL